MEKTRFIDYVAPIELNIFLKNIMEQIGETDPVKAVALINSQTMVLSNIKTGWEEQEDMICFSVMSDGTSGPQWITRLESKGIFVDELSKKALRSNEFKPTSGIETKVFVLQARKINFFDHYFFAEVEKRGLVEPINGAEIACLAREKFSNQQIGLMGIYQIVFCFDDLHFSINSRGINGLFAFKKRQDIDYAYAFKLKNE